jgi:site-specific DNA-adenine methylase
MSAASARWRSAWSSGSMRFLTRSTPSRSSAWAASSSGAGAGRRKEVINDISADVVNLFRLLQRHFQQLLDVLKWQVCSRAEFERLMAVDPATLTDLERAVRFLYLQRTAFGGKVTGRNFGVTLTPAPAST